LKKKLGVRGVTERQISNIEHPIPNDEVTETATALRRQAAAMESGVKGVFCP
jgi:HAMP domain-containing protein